MRLATRVIFTLFLLSCFATMALAQGSGSTRTPDRGGVPNPFGVTHTLKGTIEQIDENQGLILVKLEKTGKNQVFRYHSRTRYRADKGLFESKKITQDEIAVGQRVRVKFREAGLDLVELKVIRPKKVKT